MEFSLIGAAFGGLGGVGSLSGKIFGCSAFMTSAFSVSSKLALGMMAFDMIALANDFQNRLFQDTRIYLDLVAPHFGGFISDLNHKAHSSSIYNAFQYVVSGAAVYTGGYVKTAACFVAGTLVATVNGLAAIETIKAGDYVLSTDPDTMKTEYKQVLETYIRKVDRLVHLIISGEEIITTDDHPFYVQDRGFINAGNLLVGDKLISVNGEDLLIENYNIEVVEELVQVYNFQVEDFHTYFVGDSGVLVHNAEYDISEIEYRKTSKDDTVSFGDGEQTVTYRRVQGGDGSSNSSQQKITVNDDGSISIANKEKNLNVSIDNGEHSNYFKNDVRGNESYTVEFEVPKWFDDLLQDNTISQEGYRSNPMNQGGIAPKLTDTSTPGRSYELPAPWSEWLEEVASNGKIVK